MVAYLESHEIFYVSLGVVEILESNDENYSWFNDYENVIGSMYLVISPRMCYLIDIIEYASEV